MLEVVNPSRNRVDLFKVGDGMEAKRAGHPQVLALRGDHEGQEGGEDKLGHPHHYEAGGIAEYRKPLKESGKEAK